MANYLRLWTTDLTEGHGPRFDELAAAHSVPLFRTLPGCLGAVFARSEKKGYVLTAWADVAAADEASKAPAYREAVQFIGKSGVMTGEQSLEPLTICGSFSSAASVFCG